jgi:hypothetical protein
VERLIVLTVRLPFFCWMGTTVGLGFRSCSTFMVKDTIGPAALEFHTELIFGKLQTHLQ